MKTEDLKSNPVLNYSEWSLLLFPPAHSTSADRFPCYYADGYLSTAKVSWFHTWQPTTALAIRVQDFLKCFHFFLICKSIYSEMFQHLIPKLNYVGIVFCALQFSTQQERICWLHTSVFFHVRFIIVQLINQYTTCFCGTRGSVSVLPKDKHTFIAFTSPFIIILKCFFWPLQVK
jgi:hypothetical protein